MIEHHNKDRKPFKVGQLVRQNPRVFWCNGIAMTRSLWLVLDIEWSSLHSCWRIQTLRQRGSVKGDHWSGSFQSIEENDE